VSQVTVYELLCGVQKAQGPTRERQKVDRFLSVIVELPFDRAAAETAALIRADLETSARSQRGAKGEFDHGREAVRESPDLAKTLSLHLKHPQILFPDS
jgi:predicted nucleic acid-binding protein